MFEVRDLRKKEKFFIDDAFVDRVARKIGIHAVGVYACLCRHVDIGQSCYPSRQLIAEKLNISEKQVSRSIKILEEHQIIEKVRLGKRLNNRYYLIDKTRWIISKSDEGTVSPLTPKTESEGTVSPLTRDCESPHKGLVVPSNSKVTHKKVTHKKEKQTPVAAFDILLKDSDWIKKIEVLYPNVPIKKEFCKMQGWILANPDKVKNRTKWKRFMVNWLNKEVDKYPADARHGQIEENPGQTREVKMPKWPDPPKEFTELLKKIG